MKKKALGIMLGCLVSALSIGVFICPSTMLKASEVETGDVTTRESNIYWVTRTTNGRTFQRLYNAATKEWLTDWILVG